MIQAPRDPKQNHKNYTPGSTNIAGWKMDPYWVDVFPIKNGDIPASYVSLPKGNNLQRNDLQRNM